MAYDPLYGPDEQPPAPAALDVELQSARELLDQLAATNIHDDTAMVKAAAGLYYRLRSLLAAVDAERGES
jgi:hypothetical protein